VRPKGDIISDQDGSDEEDGVNMLEKDSERLRASGTADDEELTAADYDDVYEYLGMDAENTTSASVRSNGSLEAPMSEDPARTEGELKRVIRDTTLPRDAHVLAICPCVCQASSVDDVGRCGCIGSVDDEKNRCDVRIWSCKAGTYTTGDTCT